MYNLTETFLGASTISERNKLYNKADFYADSRVRCLYWTLWIITEQRGEWVITDEQDSISHR